jgi:hypothetical protein
MNRLLALAHERLSDIYGENLKFKEGARHLKLALDYMVTLTSTKSSIHIIACIQYLYVRLGIDWSINYWISFIDCTGNCLSIY